MKMKTNKCSFSHFFTAQYFVCFAFSEYGPIIVRLLHFHVPQHLSGRKPVDLGEQHRWVHQGFESGLQMRRTRKITNIPHLPEHCNTFSKFRNWTWEIRKISHRTAGHFEKEDLTNFPFEMAFFSRSFFGGGAIKRSLAIFHGLGMKWTRSQDEGISYADRESVSVFPACFRALIEKASEERAGEV